MGNSKYDAGSIKVLKGLEAIRKRPGMYIGGTGANGVYRLFREILDNAVDEYQAGYNKSIYVWWKQDQVWIGDAGRGMPVEKHPEEKISTLTVLFTMTHAGGKFDASAYKTSSGLHGVGIKATNALSDWLEVYTKRKGQWWCQKFERGKPKDVPKKVDISKLPKFLKGANKMSTIIGFSPDTSLMSTKTVNRKRIAEEIEDLSYLCPGLLFKLFLVDEGKKKQWMTKDGIRQFVDEEYTSTYQKSPFYASTKDGRIEVALKWTNQEESEVFSYVNCSFTDEGGTHLNGLNKAASSVLRRYGSELDASDLRAGMCGIIHVRMNDPVYRGQTKNELTNEDIEKEVYQFVKHELDLYFKKHTSVANHIIKRAKILANARNKANVAKQALKEVKIEKKGKKGIMPGKLVEAPNCSPKERELFIVEGESAGGCLVGCTKIPLANGRKVSMKYLEKHRESLKDNPHYTYSVDTETGFVTVGKITDAFKTKKVKILAEVELDNGEVFRCTPDHPLLGRSLEFISAKKSEGKSFLPFSIHENAWRNKYPCLYQPFYKELGIRHQTPVHHIAYIEHVRSIPKEARKSGFNIHHVDGDTRNNYPDNLRLLKISSHVKKHVDRSYLSDLARDQWASEDFRLMHSAKAKEQWRDKEKRAKLISGLRDSWSDPERNEKVSKSLKTYFSNPLNLKKHSDNMRKVMSKGDVQKKVHGPRVERTYRASLAICKAVLSAGLPLEDKHYRAYREQLSSSGSLEARGLQYLSNVRQKYFEGSQSKLLKAIEHWNHKVVRVSKIVLEEPVWVYDLTIERYHNFALSAGIFVHNSVKLARDNKYQEVLPLRGKIPNALRTKPAKFLGNEEISAINTAVGTHVGQKCRVQNCRYNKIMILTDADPDGKHIAALLIAYFGKYMPDVIKAGKLYVVDSPLYRGYSKNKYAFGFSIDEVRKKFPKGATVQITRLKGHGEANPEQVENYALNPKTRKLIQVKWKSDSMEMITQVLGNDTTYRKELLGV